MDKLAREMHRQNRRISNEHRTLDAYYRLMRIRRIRYLRTVGKTPPVYNAPGYHTFPLGSQERVDLFELNGWQ